MDGPAASLRLDFPGGFRIGPGKVALLEAVARTGSISAAGRELGMSYRRAWMLVDAVNRAFDQTSVSAAAGGARGGGAALTDFGRSLVSAYRTAETAAGRAALDAFTSLSPHLLGAPTSDTDEA